MKKVLVVLLVLVVGLGAFLYFPRGGVIQAVNAAVLAVLNGNVDAQRGGGEFQPALDGDVMATGDVVRANEQGRAVLTFFDGSSLSVEPKSNVRVVALSRTGSGGIDVTIEQTLGRTWASVSKLASPDSKFEVRTPSMVATVRGTAFETIVETAPDGRVITTIKTGEGEVLVRAEAGGEVSVPAGQQVEVRQGQPAPPAPQPQPPTPRLRFTAPAGIGYVVLDPRGLRCGSTGTTVDRQIPGCDVQGGTVLIGDVVPGTYSLVATAAQAVPSAVISAEGLGVGGTDFTARITRSFSLGDLVRSTLPVTLAAGRFGQTAFTPPDLVTSVCGAEARGRVFSSGAVEERADLLARYAREAKGQPAALVVSAAELTAVAQGAVSEAGSGLPVTVSDAVVSIDTAGMHLTARMAAGPLTVNARADIIAGASDGRLLIRLRDLDAGPLPQPAKEQIARAIGLELTRFGNSFPLVVERVAFRAGCMAIIGRTP